VLREQLAHACEDFVAELLSLSEHALPPFALSGAFAASVARLRRWGDA
jgi:hypothetical protein